MSKVHIIKSFSPRILKEKIANITNNTNLIIFDLDEDELSNVFEEANYFSLFNEEKNIIVRNIKFLSNKGEYKKENELLKRYLENENENVQIIFCVDDLNLKNNNVKKIQDNKNLIIINEYQKKELSEEINKFLKRNNYTIENQALELLKTKCNNNYDIIINELEKLFLIKKNFKITQEEIKNYVSNMIEDNYDFINAVVSKNNDMFKYLDNLIELKTEPAIIVGQLISQFKLIYFVKDALNYISEQDIANILKSHPYRIQVAKNNSFNYSLSELNQIIDNLIELDLNIKNDYQNKYQLISIFLLNLIK